MNEKATSDIEKELARVKARAEAAGLKVKAKIVDPETQGKVKVAMVDLKDKIVELHIPSHVYSGAKKGKNKLFELSGKLKDKCVEINDNRKERKEARKVIPVKVASIEERLDKLEEKSKEES